jgi:DNA primase
MYYPEELIEEVRQRNDIVEVIGSYVKLNKRGSDYKGLCPFHNEKTPSFNVNQRLQIFKCFGCGKAGNVVTFLMEYESMTFPEALKSLAERGGVKLPEADYSSEDRQYAKTKSDLYDIYKKAALYFYRQLKSPIGAEGYSYLKNRELSDETIVRFGLGYSPKSGNGLYNLLKSEGYDDELLHLSELFNYSEKYGARDKFWNRVMFPIMDVNNKVIAFGGRVMGDGEPKYLNSNETRIFEKGKNLYALNLARRSKKDYLLLCEGYVDVIALHQAGFDNAVASLGTALTGMQAKLMSRYVKKVYITYDSDGAGTKAALRAIPILKNAGISCRVINMKPYKDPDEFIKALGKEAYEQRIDEAVPGFYFEVDCMAKEYKLDEDPEEKTKFTNRLCQKMLEYPDELERTTYCQAACKKYNIPYDQFISKVKRLAAGLSVDAEAERIRYTDDVGRARPTMSEERKALDKDRFEYEKLIFTWCTQNVIYGNVVVKFTTPEDYQEGIPRRVAEAVFEKLREDNGRINPAAIINRFDTTEEQSIVADLFQTEIWEQMGDDLKIKNKAFSDAICRVVENSLKFKMAKATALGDGKLLTECINQKRNIKVLGKNILNTLE